MSDRRRAFFDTSSWIAAILSNRGASFYLLDQAAQALYRYDIVSSLDVFEEGIDTLQRKYPAQLDEFTQFFHRVHPFLVQPDRATLMHAATIVHPDDAPIVAGARAADAKFLITLDQKHLLKPAQHIKTKTGIAVVTPGTFLSTIRRD
jgi:predicted nucleic acid-binding protein